MEQQERDLARALGWAPPPPGGWDNYVVDNEAGWLRDPHEGTVDTGRW